MFASIVTLRTALAALVLVAAMPVAAMQDREPEWRLFLVQVAHIARQDPAARDAQRISDLHAQLAEADDPESRERLERKIEEARRTAETRAGFIIYGLSTKADGRGAPVSSSRTLRAFLLPSSTKNRKVLAELEPGDYVTIQRSGAKDLFSYSGRGFISAKRVSTTKVEAGWPDPKGFAPMSDEAVLPERISAIAATLTFNKSTQRENSIAHRFTMRVTDHGVPKSAGNCTVRLHVRLKTTRGDVYGPILVQDELKRSAQRTLQKYYSFDIVARQGVKLDPSGASVEVVGADWAE